MIKDAISDKIINATKEEIEEKGEKFTLDDVARRANISKKTIYNNFKDKKELIFCVIDEMFFSIKEKRLEVVNDMDMDIVEKIKRLMAIHFEFLNINYRKYEFVYGKYPDSVMYIRNYYETEWCCLEEYLNLAMKQGRIKRANMETIKVVIMGSMYYCMINKEKYDFNDLYVNEVISVILNGIRMK